MFIFVYPYIYCVYILVFRALSDKEMIPHAHINKYKLHLITMQKNDNIPGGLLYCWYIFSSVDLAAVWCCRLLEFASSAAVSA